MIAYYEDNEIDLEKDDCELGIALLLGEDFVDYGVMEMNMIIDFIFESLELPFGCYVKHAGGDVLLVYPDIFSNGRRPTTKEEVDEFFVNYYAFLYECDKIVYNHPDVAVYLINKDKELTLLCGDELEIRND